MGVFEILAIPVRDQAEAQVPFGDPMKHFAPEKLAEFIRGTLASAQREAVRQHLHACVSCTQLADLYRHIAFAGAREASYAPPDGIVRTVKAYFGTQKPAVRHARKLRFELLFDGLARPATAGARGSVVSARQLLYRIGTVYVDMEVGKESNSDRASLIGQMLDSSKPGHPLVGVPVALVNRGKSVATTSSNDNGEFQLEFAMKRDLKLSVAVDREEPVYLPITSVQAKTSTATRSRKQKANGSARKASITGRVRARH